MNDEQLLRYSRQIMLPEVDIAGQQKLLDARVLIAGVGGLGSPVALYLAAAGVGHLVLADHDCVELSNLQRQILHSTSAIDKPKVESAKKTLHALNPELSIELINTPLNSEYLHSHLNPVDLVVDATDNFAVRYALNDFCFAKSIPLVSGAAIRFEGQVAVFDPRTASSPCYRCLYPETTHPETGHTNTELNCSENGVIAPLVGIIGSIQAMEAIKLLCGVGETLTGWVQYLDARVMQWQKLSLPRRKDCVLCSKRPPA